MEFATYFTPSSAARRLDVSAQTIREMIRQGRLACVETPLGRLIDPQDLERLARERQSRGAPVEVR